MDKPKVPAVEQAIKILLTLAKNPSKKMKLTSICREVGIYKSKGYEILKILNRYGFVNKDPNTKEYSLGPEFIYLASIVLENLDYKNIAEPYIKELANETNCASFMGIIVDDYFYIIAKQDVDIGVKLTIPLGFRFPLFFGAHGKAILFSLDSNKREEILKNKEISLHGYKKPLDIKKLEKELIFYKKFGFSTDIKEMDSRYSAIASGVFGLGNKIIGAVLLIGVFEEENKIFEFGEKVKKCAEKISYALGAKKGGINHEGK